MALTNLRAAGDSVCLFFVSGYLFVNPTYVPGSLHFRPLRGSVEFRSANGLILCPPRFLMLPRFVHNRITQMGRSLLRPDPAPLARTPIGRRVVVVDVRSSEMSIELEPEM
jgi:hypothetical protein